jgi:3-deoxy-7-phosphoheptulonate synthase
MSSTIVVTEPGEMERVLSLLARPGLALQPAAANLIVADATDELFAARAAQTPGVVALHRNAPPWPLASTLLGPPTGIGLPTGSVVGAGELLLIAGPCAVESAASFSAAADAVVRAGARAVRGGVFKPRTSPYSFQGLGRDGLEILRDWSVRNPGVAIVSEVLDPREVGAVAEVAHVLQVGARNMQNAVLLRAVAEAGRPVLLKRGFGNTAAELLHSAEYILSRGNERVMLCERGIRSFEPGTRFTLDVGAVAWLKQRSRLPVIVDPSHAAGTADLVTPLALAGIAAGADGLIVEVHDHPEEAASDGDQALELAGFEGLVSRLRPLAAAVGRSIAPAAAEPFGRPAAAAATVSA